MQKVNFPFAHKLALSMVVLIVSGMLLLGGLIIQDQNKLLEKQMHSYAKILIQQLAASVKESFLTSDTLDMDVLVKNIAQHSEILGLAFYSDEKQQRNGYGLVPAALEFPNSANTISTIIWWPDYPDSSRDQSLIQTLFFSTDLPYMSYIGSVNYQDVTIGYVLLTFDQSLLIQARNKTLYTIALTTLVLSVFSIIFAFFLGKRLSRPIEAMVDVSNAISKGDYKVRFDERRDDEFGILMHSLSVMADGLLEKESVEKAFSRYVSPTVAQEVLGNLESINLGGQQVQASVLFVDIIGFTKLSKTMEPEKTNELLNEYFSCISQAAGIFGGHVDKFMGDCVMLVFGVPKQNKHHSYQAVACALLIQKIITKLNQQRQSRNQVPVNFHIAANSGVMLAGNMGSEQRMEYTVIGDAVNLAARIANHAQNNEVIIPDIMLARPGIKGNFAVEKKDCINIRGHDEPVEAVELLQKHLF
ncbi:MAG: adenylate/guanylate cyclase domain-containing protein [gamma proteobacterium symbiont of Bathyaustriella thionipta]|nr:adenylate/guanylate cyclase domain-containing protein [gamma proteobacterium symbiont of Bathyaustriella thionipta]MCU7949459.1 adenylate/guanylate cyclase domain-containing protein [gamma proteobacterium symbiont of Bathyaustriella thionipta]MCU7953122.1 adenylate/guanylate cyclase domain-containing protein [gamma proteobacterium symbiont of Bathyaustriella thionipta]MCU7956046.1 adenylate/guanylate cyclase domain-containing protein [gamma proteobacterium symbiont of Bathyaustriella thionipt